ncbi:MAG TPA: mechanosensitive ion channel [Actinomycetes bacterium]|nr:mechanosensitive ion channel [Actinomycetes bacterium]
MLMPVGQTLSAMGLVGSFRHYAERFIEQLPDLIAAVLFLFITVLLARLVRRGVDSALRKTSTEAYVHLLVAKLAYFGVMILGVVVSLSLGGVNFGVLVGSLGLATVALGFALQDIVSNFVAGIVLLLEHPFTKGDEISVSGVQGKVEDIRVRATQLRAATGEQVLVPNKILFTNVLTNSTATMHRRVEVTLSVPQGTDPSRAREALLQAAAVVEGVADEPAPSLLLHDLDEDKMELLIELWVDPRRYEPQRVRSEVLEATQAALVSSDPQLTASRAGSSPSDDKKAG